MWTSPTALACAVLGTAGAILPFCAAAPAPPPPGDPGPTVPSATHTGAALRDLAAARGLRIGTAVNTANLANDSAYASTLATEFSQVTPENVMKWKTIEPTRGAYDWNGGDKLVTFAQAHGQRVYGHNLVWYKSLPDWLTSGGFGKSELKALLKKHVQDEVRHYGTKVWAWDVINEPLEDDGTFRDSIWLDAMGTNYIAEALTWAHEANPKAKLFINEYNIEWVNKKSTAMLALVKKLRADGVPISGVGFQTHRKSPLPSDYETNLKRFTSSGFDVAVTEMDRTLKLPVTEAELADQADSYGRAVRACLDLMPRCVSYSVWGFTDKYSTPTSDGYGAPYVFDANDAAKPAFYALQTALDRPPLD